VQAWPAAGCSRMRGRYARGPSCPWSRGPPSIRARPAALPPPSGRPDRLCRVIAATRAGWETGKHSSSGRSVSDHGGAGPCGAARLRLTGRDMGVRRWGDHPRRTTHQTCRPQAVHSTRRCTCRYVQWPHAGSTCRLAVGPRRQSVGDADAVRLPEGTARQRFGTRRVARLATVDASGRPHIVVTTFALSGTTVYLVVDEKPKTTRDLKRLRNIRVNPAVSLLADHYDEDWMNLWWVRADGHAVIVDDPQVVAAAIELLVERYPQYHASRPRGPVIAVTVDTWTGWAPDQ